MSLSKSKSFTINTGVIRSLKQDLCTIINDVFSSPGVNVFMY